MTSLEPRYFERMAASLGDKSRILEWVKPGRVLDIGAGGGELSSALAGLDGCRVVAVESFKDSAEALRLRPELEDVQWLRADEISPRLGVFDTVVCSSVLHEVYSYGSPRGFGALDAAFTAIVSVLRPGGRLIIRDGVVPDDQYELASLLVPDPAIVKQYLALCPHQELALHWDGERFWGTKHAVAEAMLTITWGVETFHREAQERYQLFTAANYGRYAALFGFEVCHFDAVTQPGYVAALAEVAAFDPRGDRWFPETNGLWVFDLVGSGVRAAHRQIEA